MRISELPEWCFNRILCSLLFNATGVSQSVLGVDIRKYINNAAKEGRGFVTGNFYDKANPPVIKIAPAQPHLKKEIEQDQENSKKV